MLKNVLAGGSFYIYFFMQNKFSTPPPPTEFGVTGFLIPLRVLGGGDGGQKASSAYLVYECYIRLHFFTFSISANFQFQKCIIYKDTHNKK